jgi:hypothetical protein
MRTQSLVVAALAIAAGGCGGSSNSDGPSDLARITVAQQAVKGRLKDPSSAEFRNERVGSYQGKAIVVCGEVNAKNSFGGMTGFERFVSNGGDVTVLESEMAEGEFPTVWAQMGCG